MTEHETDASSATADAIRARLIHGFGDYHTPIGEQVILVDRLIEAVREEERHRCATIAERLGRESRSSSAERLAADIAEAIRTPPGST